MFTIKIPRKHYEVKAYVPTAHEIAASKMGRSIRYANRDGKALVGEVFDYRFDGAGVLSYAVWNGATVDYVSSFNFLGVAK